MNNTPLLEVVDLKTHFPTQAGTIKAVDGVNLTVRRGEIVGVVGESGSGKSITGFSILGLIDPPGRIVGGRILFKGRNLVTASPRELRAIRGAQIAMVFQDPMMTLNPVLRIGTQMVEAIRAHRPLSRADAFLQAAEALALVGIPSPKKRLMSFPHELSGGMRQRVAIAIAFINQPDLVIADEPTTALDVTIQAQILFEARKLCNATGAAMIWITHDLAVVSTLADRIAVMYAGRIVEEASAADIVTRPRHPYTAGLVASVPGEGTRRERLHAIPGVTPSPLLPSDGCSFQPRCTRANERCSEMPSSFVFEPGHSARCFNPLHDIAATS